MAICKETLTRAIAESERFLEAARRLQEKGEGGPEVCSGCYWANPREQAKVKRASMDLTHVLADLRLCR
jgi:hypothetical protein